MEKSPGKIKDWFKIILKGIGDFLIFLALVSVIFLASVQVFTLMSPPKNFRLVFGENGYNIFDDIFSDIDDLRIAISKLNSGAESTDVLVKVNELEDSISKISETIMDSPEKAITTTILKNDQEAIQERVSRIENEILLLTGRIDGLYTLLISSVVTIAFAILALKIWEYKKNKPNP